MSHQHPIILFLILSIIGISTTKANYFEGSTTPNILKTEFLLNQLSGQDSNTITFSEFPVGTNITNQYANRGIIFGDDGNIPFITTDKSNPTSPVLSGTPTFIGPIEGRFVNPYYNISPIAISAFSFDAGNFDINGSTLIEWFDPNNNKLGDQTNSVIGIQHFNIEGHKIARWRISIIGSELQGYAIDNLSFDLGHCDFNIFTDIHSDDCVLPRREINYMISYDFNDRGDTNVVIIDHLPVEVDYNSSIPAGNYDSVARTVTWNIGTIPLDGNGTFILKVNANNFAEPCGIFTNSCELRGDHVYGYAEANTPVCAWYPEIIYVDCNRTNGKNTGMLWENAYLDLQKALNRANRGFGSEIWVAKGTYKPSIVDPCGPAGYWTFKLINGVPVYGHFAGTETSIEQRDLNDINNETILSGATFPSASYVITAYGRNQNNLLDGFTVIGASSYGIRIENAYLKISNCLITNSSTGINSINSAFTVYDCIIQNSTNYDGIRADFKNNGALPETRIENIIIRNNSEYGILFFGVNSPIVIQNCFIHNNYVGIEVDNSSSLLIPVITKCKIFANSYYGIEAWYGSASIINNWIYRNMQSGIRILYNSVPSIIRNNTIVNNYGYGIKLENWTTPIITSSIIGGNTSGDIYNCSGSYLWLTSNGDPCFVNADANDFHLRPQSLCIDAGDPCFMDFNDKDIDGECRVMFGKIAYRVDIGADELDWPKADFDRNKIVDFFDYASWAPAWKTTDPNKSLDLDNDVDIDDLSKFCDDWLWQAPW